MKRRLLLVLTMVCISTSALAVEEPKSRTWKGTPRTNKFSVGGMAGIGVFDGEVGPSIVAHMALMILEKGFIPEEGDDPVNDQTFLELQFGPLFVLDSTAYEYSLHLRWDFHKDDDWSVFAIGGIGGIITGSKLGSLLRGYPRFGVGAHHWIGENLALRAELSHENIGLGATVML